jgi:hypothetical protein
MFHYPLKQTPYAIELQRQSSWDACKMLLKLSCSVMTSYKPPRNGSKAHIA